jgi:hypothetical protein
MLCSRWSVEAFAAAALPWSASNGSPDVAQLAVAQFAEKLAVLAFGIKWPAPVCRPSHSSRIEARDQRVVVPVPAVRTSFSIRS